MPLNPDGGSVAKRLLLGGYLARKGQVAGGDVMIERLWHIYKYECIYVGTGISNPG